MKNRNQKQESIIKTLAEESRFINQEFDELFPTDEEKAYDYFDSLYKQNTQQKEKHKYFVKIESYLLEIIHKFRESYDKVDSIPLSQIFI